MRLIGWRHPVRHVRRKAVRGIYRSLVPRKRGRRHRGGSRRSSGGRASYQSANDEQMSPACCGGCLLGLPFFLGGIVALAVGAQNVGMWIWVTGGILGLIVSVVLTILFAKTPTQ